MRGEISVDKTHRVLTLMTRLINGEVIKTDQFSDENRISHKTVQRDMNNLNYFFYESMYWSHKETKVVFDRKKGGYTLINNSYSNDSLSLLSLLIKIKSLTPLLHYSVYSLFHNQIKQTKIEDQYTLMRLLNHFNIRKDILPGVTLMNLQKSIVKKLKVRIELQSKIVITPLSLMYMHYDYWLTYEYQNTIYTIKVRDIKGMKLLDTTFENVQSTELVTFDIDLSIWEQFKSQFSIVEVLKKEQNHIRVLVACTELDTYYIAYQLAPLAQVIQPQKYIDRFVERLEQIKAVYQNK